MQKKLISLGFILAWLTIFSFSLTVDAQTATPPPALDLIYTVLPGDTLFRIAGRFNTTYPELARANGITYPAQIYAGQQLRIPGAAGTLPSVPPTQTAHTPSTTTTYTVARGDTLYRVALKNNTSVQQLITLNNLRNPNIIYVGQNLIIPISTTPTETSVPLSSASGNMPIVTFADGYSFDYGIQAYVEDQNAQVVVSEIKVLGMRWVKIQVLWHDIEQTKGQPDFTALDRIVDTLKANNLNVLFTVTSAPVWARSSTDENGPPDNFSDYGLFMTTLAQHYAGRVQAYEIWHEPNLRREWHSTLHDISASSYIELLRVGYYAIKSADPDSVVVSAGLAPTGYNDGFNAANDRLFLRELYASGLAEVSDAIGSHPKGWANPPDSVCCSAPVGVTTHYQDPSFYFLNTLNDYRQIMVENNDGTTPIWVTEFGWGTSEDTDPPPEWNIFVSYTTLGEQAIYITRAFEVGAELGYVGPMFLYNLNGCLPQLPSIESCYYSLLDLETSPRPSFMAVQQLTPDSAATVQPEVTTEVISPTLIPQSTPETTASG